MKRLKRYLTGASIGLASLIYGCESTPEEQRRAEEKMLMFSLGYGTIVESDPQRAAAMGLTSQIMRDYDVAREGKSQVIIIGRASAINDDEEISEKERNAVMDRIFKEYGLGKYVEEEKKRRAEATDKIFRKYKLGIYKDTNGDPHLKNEPRFDGRLCVVSCNSIEDIDKDGLINYPEEYFGIKEIFNKGERITVSLKCSKKVKNIKYILLDRSNGKEVEGIDIRDFSGWSGVYNSGHTAIYNMGESELRKLYPKGKLPDGKINELKSGDYRAVWSSKDEIIATWDFQVSDRLKIN